MFAQDMKRKNVSNGLRNRRAPSVTVPDTLPAALQPDFPPSSAPAARASPNAAASQPDFPSPKKNAQTVKQKLPDKKLPRSCGFSVFFRILITRRIRRIQLHAAANCQPFCPVNRSPFCPINRPFVAASRQPHSRKKKQKSREIIAALLRPFEKFFCLATLFIAPLKKKFFPDGQIFLFGCRITFSAA